MLKRVRGRGAVALALALGLAVTAGAGAASATPGGGTPRALEVVRTISDDYALPLQFAVQDRTILVADSGPGNLYRVGRDAPVRTGPGITGVAFGDGGYAYTRGNPEQRLGQLVIVKKSGRTVVADLAKFERRNNPDSGNRYGVKGRVSDACRTQLEAGLPVPAKYTGQVDSNPYAVAYLGHGSWAVADAGANAILKVDHRGRISVIAVLPPQPATIDAGLAAAAKAPACAGATYRFEPVPTDVETHRGHLLVTTLPGGPEGPGAGARGSVYAVGWGWSERVATGFAGATNLAVTKKGTVYVAELGAGRVSKVHHGGPKPVLTLPGAVGLEWAHGRLYASTAPVLTGGSGPGTILELG